jgi:hypothetical protein
MSSITGTIIRAGTINVDGESLTGFFVECTGPDIRALSEKNLYNSRVRVTREDRRGPGRVSGPSFTRLADHGILENVITERKG